MTDDDKTDPIMPDEIVLRSKIAALFDDLPLETRDDLLDDENTVPWAKVAEARDEAMRLVEEALHDAYGQLALAQKERDELRKHEASWKETAKAIASIRNDLGAMRADRDRLSARVAELEKRLARAERENSQLRQQLDVAHGGSSVF